MLHTIQFEISGFIILAVLIIIFHFKRTAPSYPNRTFTLLSASAFTAAFCEVLLHLLIQLKAPHAVYTIVSGISYLVRIMVPLAFTLYALAVTGSMYSLSRRKIKLLLLPPLAAVFLILSIFTAVLIHESTSGEVTASHLILKISTFITSLYYAALGVLLLVQRKELLRLLSLSILTASAAVCLAAGIVQFLFPPLNVLEFTFSLSILVASLTVQKSEDTNDSITGLYNQSAFEIMNHRRFKTGEQFHIIGILYDDLPFLTSTLGIRHIHEVLKQSSDYMKHHLKQADVYHFNDGKFCLVFHDNNLETVYSCIDTFKERFVQPWIIRNISVKIFPRISIISCPEDADSTESVIELFDLLSSADMYKKDGIILASSMDTTIRKRSAYLDRTVKNSINEGLIDVFYQPIFCTGDNRIIGAEALIRMKDERGVYVSPEEFIPVAEKNGTILRLGEFVFEKVCRLLSEIKAEDYGIKKIDINLSVVQCMQESLADQIISIANLYRIPFSLLNLEITETAAAYSQETLRANMSTLSEEGIELSLDDYGSGYSNMNYMINLPFDMIKIDKGIVWNAFTDSKSYTALAFTISMINALKMTVLAEGIETQEQAESLTSLGCQYLQGYYYSQPLPKDTFLQLLWHQKIELEAEGVVFDNTPLSVYEKDTSSEPVYTSLDEGVLNGADELEELDSLEEVN